MLLKCEENDTAANIVIRPIHVVAIEMMNYSKKMK
jgi:hypothetical protein